MDNSYYFENKYSEPFITCCIGNSIYAGDKSYEDFLRSCFNALQNEINSKDDYYRGSYAPSVYSAMSNKCADAWTNAYKQMIQPVVSDVQANADAASTAETSNINDAIQARKAGINAGMGRARAGLLGDATSNTNTSNVYNNAYSTSIQNQGSTQADYLQKMGQAAAVNQCASNMQKGAALNAIGASLQGVGQGASLGATLA